MTDDAPVISRTTETTTSTPQAIVTERVVQAPHATGFLTSEFWLNIAGVVAGMFLCYHPKDSMNEFGVMLIGSCVLGYTFGRSLTKSKV